jgi:hypothetical protein|tara:strand:+ start:16942 stop:17523 length:582 start_codon:yes stop_codon:yes gene_type:complete
MCDPGTIAAVSLAVSAIGTAATFTGQMQQQRAQEAAASFRAGVMRNNAVRAENAAQDAIARGAVDEAALRRDTERLIGAQIVAGAGQGQLVNRGSMLVATRDASIFGELDAQTIRANAEREALSLRTQAGDFRLEAQAVEAGGKSSLLGPAGTALTGLGTIASRYARFDKERVFNSTSPSPTGPRRTSGSGRV